MDTTPKNNAALSAATIKASKPLSKQPLRLEKPKTTKAPFDPIAWPILITNPKEQQTFVALEKAPKTPLLTVPFTIPGLELLNIHGIYYVPQDTSLHFNDPPVLDSITAAQMTPLLKKASQIHKFSRQGFFRWLFPKQSKKIKKLSKKLFTAPKALGKTLCPTG